MRKIQIIGLALVAIFAFSAIAAASAFAAPEWLFNGLTFTGKLAVLSAGTLLLEDLKGGLLLEAASVNCTGTNTGAVESSAAGEIAAIENIACTNEKNCPNPSATPVNLPWSTVLSLAGTPELLIDTATTTAGTKVVGWKVVCTGITDECTLASGKSEMGNNSEGVTSLFVSPPTEPANCTRGGTGQGIVTGEILIFHHEGILSISNE
jgi:hypothetical protein